MNDDTQLLLLGAVTVGLFAMLGSARARRDTFVSGNVVGIAADLKRQGIETLLHVSAAAVADSAQVLGCAYMGALAGAVQAVITRSAGRPVACTVVTDELKKLENTLATRINGSKLAPATKAALLKYRLDAVATMRAVFDPLCRNGMFDPVQLQKAVDAVRASYCGALPTPAVDALAKPAGVNDPRLVAAVQNAQKAFDEWKAKTAAAKDTSTPTAMAGVQLEAKLYAARAVLLSGNISALKGQNSSIAQQARQQAANATQAALQADPKTKSPQVMASLKNSAAAAAKALEVLYQTAQTRAITTPPPPSTAKPTPPSTTRATPPSTAKPTPPSTAKPNGGAKDIAQEFSDKGCKSNHTFYSATSKTWGCHNKAFPIRTDANHATKNKEAILIPGTSNTYLYDAMCVNTQECADIIKKSKLV